MTLRQTLLLHCSTGGGGSGSSRRHLGGLRRSLRGLLTAIPIELGVGDVPSQKTHCQENYRRKYRLFFHGPFLIGLVASLMDAGGSVKVIRGSGDRVIR
jgi:hypothetical protein